MANDLRRIDPEEFRLSDFPVLIRIIQDQGREIERLKRLYENQYGSDMNTSRFLQYLEDTHGKRWSKGHLNNMVSQGKVPCYRKAGERWFVKSEIDQWVKDQREFMKNWSPKIKRIYQ